MEKYFAGQIAQRGLKAVVEDESGEYNEYKRFLNFWDIRLFWLERRLQGVFPTPSNFYRNHRGAGRGAPAKRSECKPLTSSTGGALQASAGLASGRRLAVHQAHQPCRRRRHRPDGVHYILQPVTQPHAGRLRSGGCSIPPMAELPGRVRHRHSIGVTG